MSAIDPGAILRALLVFLVPGIFAITVHEVAHGWVARRFGDDTAARAGRLSLNPIRHIDPVGTLIVPLTLYFFDAPPFGWAKPVPVVASRLGNPRRDMVFVAAGGPGANLLMAMGWALVIAILVHAVPVGGGGELVFAMANFGIRINVALAVFNMLPIPPLDGGRVLVGLLPRRPAAIVERLEPIGLFLVFGLLLMEYYTDLRILSVVVFPAMERLALLFLDLAGAR